ncbi:hypothetical protein BR93DRAFT_44331 [Coniochaeta sp. PMI_546]|nr:hypothetical protein BR93DRAFT_44331 [Coniochaeta sp. PMI_546]
MRLASGPDCLQHLPLHCRYRARDSSKVSPTSPAWLSISATRQSQTDILYHASQAPPGCNLFLHSPSFDARSATSELLVTFGIPSRVLILSLSMLSEAHSLPSRILSSLDPICLGLAGYRNRNSCSMNPPDL